MLAVMKPKSKIRSVQRSDEATCTCHATFSHHFTFSFSALAPLLATMEDDNYSVDDRSRRGKNNRHRRDRSIVERVKDMLMGDNAPANIPEGDEHEKGDGGDRLLDMQSVKGESSVGDPADFSGQPVRELPNQLVTEAASIVPSGTSSLADLDDESRASSVRKAPSTHQEELRCVIAIVRHGDRTPKQKLKGKFCCHRVVSTHLKFS